MKPKLLVVDDEPDMIDLLRDIFGEDFDVLGARGPREAEASLAREKDIAVAIVDYMMPDGDGLTLVRSLREQGRHMPVILYSAFLESQFGEWVGELKLRVVSKADPIAVLERAVRELAGLKI